VIIIVSPPPPSLAGLTPREQFASRAVHACLYLLLLAFPVGGYLISRGSSIDFYCWPIAGRVDRAIAVRLGRPCRALPTLFYAALVLHIGAVLKRHFGGREALAVRRMLR
jgi:cytochrome b561